MKRWRIENTASGVVLGVYEGETENDALDAMARDAGYRDYREASEVAGGSENLAVTEMGLHWRDLGVTNGDGESCGTLGEVIDRRDSSIGPEHLDLGPDGSINSWPQHLIAAPDEEPDWDTPRVPVDWSGFKDALTRARDVDEMMDWIDVLDEENRMVFGDLMDRLPDEAAALMRATQESEHCGCGGACAACQEVSARWDELRSVMK